MSDQSYKVMATIAHQDFVGYDEVDQPIYEDRLGDRVWLEGFTSKQEAQRYAELAVQGNPEVVINAWVVGGPQAAAA